MNKKTAKFLSMFIPSHKARVRFRNYHQLKELSKTNIIKIDPSVQARCRLNISGENNTIIIGKLSGKGTLDIQIVGTNNTIELADSISVSTNISLVMGGPHINHGPVTNSRIEIGQNTSIESLKATIYTSNSKITVGASCMISYDVNLYHTDGHPILDYDTGEVINRVNHLKIGDHVWIGWGATLLKNTKIPDDCIIGWGSVVSGTFTQSHSAICGNPAVCVTKPPRKITWAKRHPNYNQNPIVIDNV